MTKSTSLIGCMEGHRGALFWWGRRDSRTATRVSPRRQEQREGLGHTFSIQSIVSTPSTPTHDQAHHVTTSPYFHWAPPITKPVLPTSFLVSQIFRHPCRCISAEPPTSFFVCYLDAALPRSFLPAVFPHNTLGPSCSHHPSDVRPGPPFRSGMETNTDIICDQRHRTASPALMGSSSPRFSLPRSTSAP